MIARAPFSPMPGFLCFQPELCKPSVRVAMREPHLLQALVWSGTMAKVASVELLQPALSVLTREPLKFEWLRFLKVLHGVP